MVVTLRGWKPCPDCEDRLWFCHESDEDDYGSYVPARGCGGTKRVFWYKEYDFRRFWANLAQWGALYRAFQEGYSAGVTDAR